MRNHYNRRDEEEEEVEHRVAVDQSTIPPPFIHPSSLLLSSLSTLITIYQRKKEYSIFYSLNRYYTLILGNTKKDSSYSHHYPIMLTVNLAEWNVQRISSDTTDGNSKSTLVQHNNAIVGAPSTVEQQEDKVVPPLFMQVLYLHQEQLNLIYDYSGPDDCYFELIVSKEKLQRNSNSQFRNNQNTGGPYRLSCFAFFKTIRAVHEDEIESLVIHLGANITFAPQQFRALEIFQQAVQMLEQRTQHHIAVVGQCRLYPVIQELVFDQFATVNRIWNYRYSTKSYQMVGGYAEVVLDLDNQQRCDMIVGSHKEEGILLHMYKTQSQKVKVFYNHLQQLQFSSNFLVSGGKEFCDTHQILLHKSSARGMCGALHLQAYSFTRAIEFNRIFVLNDSTFSFFTNDWTELFLPYSICKWNWINEFKDSQVLNGLYGTDEYNKSARISIIEKDHPVKITFFVTPSKFPTQFMDSARAFRSHLMRWMMTLSYPMREFLTTTRKQVFGEKLLAKNNGLAPRCIAMHVRHGDKLISEAKLVDLQVYLDVLNKKINEFKSNLQIDIGNVFLMTDNTTIIDRIEAIPNRPYKLHYLTDVDRGDNDVAMDIETGIIDPSKKTIIGRLLLAELLIASDCDYFIGTMSSNIGRTIAELMSAKLNKEYILWESVDDTIWSVDP
ncbi:putative N-acetyl-beta-D-glucosaminide alpha-1,6-fucosyltransferase [Cavenderia fasciculata]|uniref:N-acetyl-beta-D-glucosaminide alpha-1,6-fucosyltransferase n=1 Tax=Cavenderia fasciculata TaxID=261658 RepID=F4QCM8_CACFS|nr:putative N-acetyl-beta-D-glucosaminide alpha-1,6-fucosyltransferase [Cavenderia fasciculata]EGG14456.1 putative N-acetyl-beta-D-glucosaminide alpha-1,6-fucosyltransferase [Cavenderia fasciculata]|eukprot:XP_004353865.1 putative N-acetyl-beta-D-glucosaminide alpha-1,6-fucosyltransferase [Cavenderia fasciculata]